MQTINTAAAFWTAQAGLGADDAATRLAAIATLMRLAVEDGGAVGGRAAETLMAQFGARVMMA